MHEVTCTVHGTSMLLVTVTRTTVCLALLLSLVWVHYFSFKWVWCRDDEGEIFTALPSYCVGLKVKESRNRPGVAQRVPEGLGSQISWHSAHEGGEVSLTHWPPLPPGMFLILIFTGGWVDPRAMVRSEGICRRKIQWHHRESIPGPSYF